jgi:hypothetical protein
MANRQRARVSYQPLRLRATLDEGLAALPSFGNPEAEQQARGFAALASDFGRIADTMAAQEGQRAAMSNVTDLSWRPTNLPTIRGRAYDQAGLSLYTDRLEGQVRIDLQKAADESQGDPNAFAQRVSELRTGYEETALFPQVRNTFDVMFTDQAQRHARVLVNQAQAAAREQQLAVSRARIDELANAASRQLESVRAGNDEARDLLVGTEAQIERTYAAAVADGLMDAEAAERAVQERQRSTAVNYYVIQAQQAATAGTLDELRAELSEDYQSGALGDLDAAGWRELQTGLDRVEREHATQAVFRTDLLDRQVDAVSERIAIGFGDETEQARLHREAASHPDAGEAQRQVLTDFEMANRLHSVPVPQARAEVAGLRQAATNDRALRMVTSAERMLNAIEREARSNPLGLAERRGLTGEIRSLFDEGSQRDLPGAIRHRIAQRNAASLGLGVPSVFFRADEVDQIRMLVNDDPMQAAAMAGALVDALGDDASGVLRELNGQAEPMMESGLVLAAGGSQQAARDVLVGYARDANGSRLPSVPSDRRVVAITDHVDAALIDTPDDSRRIQDTAHAIARARVAEMGIDPDSDEAVPVFRSALDAAAGAQMIDGVRFGGFTAYDRPYWFTGSDRVLVPPTIRADLFPQVLRAVRDVDLAGLPNPPVDASGQVMRASVLHGAVPIAVPGGYRFATGDPRSDDPAYVADSQGNAFVLPLDRLEPVLRTRVPEAFR